MYLFQFDAVPTAAAPQSADLAGAEVTVIVKAETPEDAEIKARSYVMSYAYLVTAVLEARGPVPQPRPDWSPESVALLRKAEREGIAALFVSWPKKERPETDPPEFRTMGPPAGDESKEH